MTPTTREQLYSVCFLLHACAAPPICHSFLAPRLPCVLVFAVFERRDVERRRAPLALQEKELKAIQSLYLPPQP
jgi:hypothetical protein